MDYTCLKANQKVTETELVYDLNSLYDYFSRIPDTRSKLGKQYPLTLLLIWILLAKLAGQDKPSAIAEWVAHRQSLWIEYRLTPKAKTASHMTYRRVLAETVSCEALEDVLTRYHRQQLQEGEEIVLSLDGKTVRGTIPAEECQGIHLLAVYVPERGLVLAEAAVGRKENEIVVAPQVLKQVNLAGKIVIADALHTQKSFCQELVAAGAEYVLTAKGNQSHTRWAIEKLFVPEACNLQKGARLSRDFQSFVQIQKGHGRIEKRIILTSTRLNQYLDDWPGLAQVFRIEKLVWYAQGTRYTRTIRYGFTSLSPSQAGPERILTLVKEYWGIESGLHYRRDVTLQEDATRLTVGQAGHAMAIFNNLAIGLCLTHQQNVASARRYFDAFPRKALDLLLSANPRSL